VAAEHHTSAEGICQQNAVGYRRASNMQQMHQGIDWLLTEPCDRPLLLEVITDAETDADVYKLYYRSL
jgi:2-succinyl-5-enolpyruvyl-6-hydroxy-3-cyclohexene-1-carboxylate synthase